MQAENVTINDIMHAMEAKKREYNEEMKASLQSLLQEKQDLNDKVNSFIGVGIRNLNGNVEKRNVYNSAITSLVSQTSNELDIMKGTQFLPQFPSATCVHSSCLNVIRLLLYTFLA
ncbi:hypothetical protein DPMN_144265 [Dreissena polymorpha]|uniref:Uncharacterized protein n=1 Tax=Dreissena polymorpha TaxID=45954 RepID=A0A9D4JME5_DREPO|nr:hypothetical protein DPMN_144265 [Dreissena polymorpha]